MPRGLDAPLRERHVDGCLYLTCGNAWSTITRMIRMHGVRLGTALVIGLAAFGLGGCSSKMVIDAGKAQESVAQFVADNTEAKASNVKCPDDIDAKVGVEFDCTFTAADGDYTAHLKITKVDGTNVGYDIETNRA